jgi:4-oxalocrotonate tautomerase
MDRQSRRPDGDGNTNASKASDMPIINIKFIKDVVATDEQKAELIVKMTDTFVGVLGDVVRPFTYVVIDETPVGQWGIAGVPMPDLPYLVGPEHAEVIEKSNKTMREAIEQMAQDAGQADSSTA